MAITALVQPYLGQDRRAGCGILPTGTPQGEDAIYRGAGFAGPQRLEIAGRVITRTTEEILASAYSLSSSAPHLFGAHLSAFDAELRTLLAGTSTDQLFSEQLRSMALDVWR